MSFQKNTKKIIGVFFIILLISIIGVMIQWQKKITHTVRVRGGSFSEGIVGTPRFINPVLAQSQSDKDLTKLVFGSMIWQDKQGKNQYGLAEDFQKISPKEYKLTLKKNLFFQDGKPITIDDLIFTIEKIQNPVIKSPLMLQWEGVRVEKTDNYTAHFFLEQSYSDFVKNFSIGILPKHIWSSIKDEEFLLNIHNSNNVVGSGNYQIDKIYYKDSGIPERYLLKRNKKSKAYIDKINIFIYENEQDLIEAYRKKEINAAYGLSLTEDNYHLFNQSLNITGKLPRIFGLFFNQKKQKILKDKTIREFINLSIPREKIVKDIFYGYAYPINSPIGRYKKQNEKIEEIRKKIEKKGWKKNKQGIYEKKVGSNTQIMSFDVSTPNIKELVDIANEIKKTLAEKGILINIRVFDQGNLHQKIIRPRDYEILLFGYMIEKNTDLYAFWHSSQKNDPGLNISLYENKLVDKTLEQLRREQQPEQLETIENEIMKDIPAAFIYSPAFTYILPKKIKGEKIAITEKQDRFNNIEDWYIYTRKIWNIFLKK